MLGDDIAIEDITMRKFHMEVSTTPRIQLHLYLPNLALPTYGYIILIVPLNYYCFRVRNSVMSA